ncbi:MAG: bifunctional [glutamine synthetase] adenylyltransferase/[glutamine synthetase]-adenylyl-L-tyrosine phosphorylase [Alphaproteobacteria bacterium]|nr:bifunctional [glutamine synthetase] adenylyltransferase/[glutamine synthetase]-adenylyl-L-tyrosine phosphorylase [Alphaproteobacteria bacterium]
MALGKPRAPASRAATALPAPLDRKAVELGFERWAELAAAAPRPARTRAQAFAKGAAGRALLTDLFGHSPFLGQCALDESQFLIERAADDPDRAMAAILQHVAELGLDAEEGTAPLARDLRIARRRTALTVAIADLTGRWPLERVTQALSDFAEAALQAALGALLSEGAAEGQIAIPDPEYPGRGSGLAVIGMGKLGARELNYSSDIDLMLFFDQDAVRYRGSRTPEEYFIRLTQRLVRLLQDRTEHGYVFRVDLRLRPDPGSTPVVMPMAAAEQYYETFGQNWERAAMIKARAVAGDIAAGEAFLKRLVPYVWRRHLDFAAIADIHSLKRQIHQHKGHGTVAVAGHNIKLGRGGIREIEFFAQTQQLIAGGRDPRLRAATTLGALDALVATGRLEAAVRDELVAAYRYLRTLEHRLQMLNDEQTQLIPEAAEALDHLARFMGFAERAQFEAETRAVLMRVESHYARLFEAAPALSEGGNLVFTGVEDDPETLRTLAGLGYGQPPAVAATIRGWHHGRYRAMRSERAREALTALMPALLKVLAETGNPDYAFARFDEFLKNLPAGVQVFALFAARPQLLALTAEILGTAPRLSEILSRGASLLDAVLGDDFFAELPARAAIARQIDDALAGSRDLQDALDALRRVVAERRFQIGLHLLQGKADGARAGRAYAALAEAALERLAPVVEADFAQRHGRIKGGAMAVVGLGKLGGGEMTAASDLDLIFVYHHPPEAQSDGARSLPASHYYQRLSQAYINAITAPTAEGKLYDVDMRLRPSGNAGPIAVPLEGFLAYQMKDAWTWEHMALTRARVVSGSPALVARVREAIASVLRRRRDPAKLVADVIEMRARIEHQHGGRDPWDLKHVAGGQVDVEFVAQTLLLRHGAGRPEVLQTNTREALQALAEADALGQVEAESLIAAYRLYGDLMALLRLAIEGRFDPAAAPPALLKGLARIGDAKDFAALEAKLKDTQARLAVLCPKLIAAAMASPTERSPDMTTTLDLGAEAPAFDLPADGGGRASLTSFKGKPLVLYFYPKDDTSGCTSEALDFTAQAKAFAKLGAAVVGVSRDSVKRHDAFKAKHKLKVTLAADEDGKTCEAYGTWVEKSMYGRKYMGIERATFLIDGRGRIRGLWRKVKIPGHVAEVLAALKALSKPVK